MMTYGMIALSLGGIAALLVSSVKYMTDVGDILR